MYCRWNDSVYQEDLRKIYKLPFTWDRLKNKTIFLSGASGLIGSAIADILFMLNHDQGMHMKLLLAGRHENRMNECFRPFVEGKDYQFIFYDAVKGENINIQADFIICGAGNADPERIIRQPVETMLGNILGLNSLLELMAKGGAKRLLYISSGEVYGRNFTGDHYEEKDYGYVDILNPRACYPCAKRAAETLCEAYRVEYGVDSVITRPCHIYGPEITDNDSRATAQFVRKACKGEDIIMKSAGLQLRSYCYSLDGAAAILGVLLNGESGQAYNISDKRSIITIREFAEVVAELSGVRVKFEPPSDEELHSYNLMEKSVLDAEKLEKLGWRAKTNIVDGIKKILNIRKHYLT